jgi:hypothetical protein
VFTARYVLPTQCIYVFCVDLRTSSDYFPTLHKLFFLSESKVVLPSLNTNANAICKQFFFTMLAMYFGFQARLQHCGT